MQTANAQSTRSDLITLILWPFSIVALFIALYQFVVNGSLSVTVIALWTVGMVAYWLFVVVGSRMVMNFGRSNIYNLLQAVLVVGGLIYTLVFLLIVFGI